MVTPISGSVLFEQLPQCYLADYGLFFLQQTHAIFITREEKTDLRPKLSFPPSNKVFLREVSLSRIEGHFPKLRVIACEGVAAA